jgi:hypothetical protein
VYCRPPGSKNVFLGEGLDSWSVTKELKDWRDKSIASIPTESVRSLTYSLNNRQFEFVRDSSSWKRGETPVENSVMSTPLTSLANLHADDFVDTVIRFTSSPIGLSVKGTTNLTLQLYPSAPDSARYFVQSSNSPQIFLINKFAAQQLLKPIDHSRPAMRSPFAKKEETKPAPAPAKVVTETKTPPPPVVEKKVAQTVPEQKTVIPPKRVQEKPAEVRPAPVRTNPAGPLIKEKQSPPPVMPDLSSSKKFPSKKPPAVKETKEAVPQTSEEQVIEKPSKPSKPTPTPPAPQPAAEKSKPSSGHLEDDGDLTVYTVKSGDTMPIIA